MVEAVQLPYIYNEDMLEWLIREAEEPELEYVTFSDLNFLFESGYHIAIFGKTRSGKTVLLQNLLYDHWNEGFKVIHRDDGGLEFLKIVNMIDDDVVVYIPEKCKFECEAVIVKSFDWNKPYKLAKELLETKTSFNVIIFDNFCLDKDLTVMPSIAKYLCKPDIYSSIWSFIESISNSSTSGCVSKLNPGKPPRHMGNQTDSTGMSVRTVLKIILVEIADTALFPAE